MSKRSGIWVVTWPLSATLAWCMKIINQCFRPAAQIASAQACSPDGPSEVALESNAFYPIQIDFGEDRIELNELIAVLRVGDRIRLFCDDGVLVAEKVSQTQLRVVHSQSMAALIH
jgi:hypothetical protein